MSEKYITKENENYALLDKQTGELLKYNQVQKVTLDEFIMVFFSCYPNVFKLEGNQLKLLMCIWKYSSLNNDNQGNLFYNTAVFKQYVRAFASRLSHHSKYCTMKYFSALLLSFVINILKIQFQTKLFQSIKFNLMRLLLEAIRFGVLGMQLH